MSAQIFEGQGATPGIGIGRAVSIQTAPVDVYRISIVAAKIETEVERFRASLLEAEREIEQTEAQVRRKMGADLAAIFETAFSASDSSRPSQRTRSAAPWASCCWQPSPACQAGTTKELRANE